MKPRIYKFRLFGWRIFASRQKWRLMPPRGERGKATRSKMREVRNQRYRQTGGCCEACGRHFDKDAMELHHILPYASFVRYARKKWNLMLLCPRCHFIAHHNLAWQWQMMQRTANQHGIDLAAECRRAASHYWKKLQKADCPMEMQ